MSFRGPASCPRVGRETIMKLVDFRFNFEGDLNAFPCARAGHVRGPSRRIVTAAGSYTVTLRVVERA